MPLRPIPLFTALVLSISPISHAQMTLTGRLLWPPLEGAKNEVGIGHILVFGSLPGPDKQPLAFRSWETNPVGWWRLSGPAGRYTLLFTQPGQFMRPAIVSNLYTRDGENINLSRIVRAPWDEACLDESAWDKTAAHEYFQPFVARGKSITQVGFKLAHDGVDGAGPGGQDMVISIHEVNENEQPAKWPRIGPEMPVVNVDCGGAKSYAYSAGFNSGEVPTTPGKMYAVKLTAKADDGKFQPFWHPIAEGEKFLPCYRAKAPAEHERTSNHLWMTIASDSDGLLIPYNKRVHREFNQLTKFSRVWSQTYVAKGRSLAGIVLYAAASGVQPSMNLQRLQITVWKEGPKPESVGIAKLAIGNGLYTGDASWGTFGAVYDPAEVPLEPGKTYRLQFESIETPATLGMGTFANIKGMKSDGRPGFNPYRKHPLDDYPQGAAILDGVPQNFSLDMQVIEYASGDIGHEKSWGKELLKAGNFEKEDDWSAVWTSAAAKSANIGLGIEPGGGSVLHMSGKEKKFDAVVAQRVAGLARASNYFINAAVRANQLPSEQCCSMIGIDLTGQTENPDAATVKWTPMPAKTGYWESFIPDPFRPTTDTISVFLRLRANDPAGPAPVTEFDRISLREVDIRPLSARE